MIKIPLELNTSSSMAQVVPARSVINRIWISHPSCIRFVLIFDSCNLIHKLDINSIMMSNITGAGLGLHVDVNPPLYPQKVYDFVFLFNEAEVFRQYTENNSTLGMLMSDVFIDDIHDIVEKYGIDLVDNMICVILA